MKWSILWALRKRDTDSSDDLFEKTEVLLRWGAVIVIAGALLQVAFVIARLLIRS